MAPTTGNNVPGPQQPVAELPLARERGLKPMYPPAIDAGEATLRVGAPAIRVWSVQPAG